MTTLHTARLRLEPFEERHLDGLHAMNRLPEVMEYISGVPETREQTAASIARVQRCWAAWGTSWWAFVDVGSGRVVGAGAIQYLRGSAEPVEDLGSLVGNPLEIGWRLHPDVWRQGLATEAAQRMAAFAFERFPIQELVAVRHPDNTASGRVMDRLGMRFRGMETWYGRSVATHVVSRQEWQGGLHIEPLTAERQDDFLRYFEGAAFADNPRWRSCYCQFMQVDHRVVNWQARTAEENRAAACAGIACGRMQGLLAYRGAEVVGWCQAAPRLQMDGYADEPLPHGAAVGQITCFVVARVHRRTGVARALLDAACHQLRQQGMRVVLAHPSRVASSDAQHHYGPLTLYLSAGFSVVQEREDGLVVVQKDLQPLPGAQA